MWIDLCWCEFKLCCFCVLCRSFCLSFFFFLCNGDANLNPSLHWNNMLVVPGKTNKNQQNSLIWIVPAGLFYIEMHFVGSWKNALGWTDVLFKVCWVIYFACFGKQTGKTVVSIACPPTLHLLSCWARLSQVINRHSVRNHCHCSAITEWATHFRVGKTAQLCHPARGIGALS